MSEALAVALAGGIIGSLASVLTIDFVRGAVPALGPAMSAGMPYPVMLAAIAIALGVGGLAALAPTLVALRTPVFQTLREVT